MKLKRCLLKKEYINFKINEEKMVELRLPANSKITKGKYYKASIDAKNIKKFHIYRYDPESGNNPSVDIFEVDMDK